MPYRRLPNTDSARIRAMKSALDKGDKIHPFKLAYNQDIYVKIKSFLPQFEKAVLSQKQALSLQATRNKAYLNLMSKAQMYLSHFVQVLNFAILREEQPKSIRQYFGLNINDKRVPSLNTEEEIIEKGRLIIEGERKRTQEGKNPLLNPSISLVKIHYEKFTEAYRYQKQLKENSYKAQLKVASLRMKADQLILDVWNQVEKYHENYNPAQKRMFATEYGLVYIFRKNEKKEKENMFQLSA
ncbi:MAG: hypothetical protein JXR51_01770 [Bacteroidales bacterium]|nr:hypothetical protein [Bacteroidales bacterium]MBN2755873.1 hypothetical protein [Bacteroidales bacterium]